MWLYRNPLMVVMVIVSVWVKTACAKSNSRPLSKNFHILGCQSNYAISSSGIFKSVNLDYLKSKGGFLFGVSGASETTISILSRSPESCKLPSEELFCALLTTNEEKLTVTFHQEEFEDNDPQQMLGERCFRESRNQTQGSQDGGTESIQKQSNVTCYFKAGDHLALESGYGFIACRGARLVQWTGWLDDVSAVEEKATKSKTMTIIGVGIGTCVAVFAILACVMCRLRSTVPPGYHSGRRPSNTSGVMRTASTHDHASRT